MATKNSKAEAKTPAKKLPTLKATYTAPKFEVPSPNPAAEIEQAEQEMGQLSLDVYDSPTELTIIAPIAGVKLEDINLSITEDVLTISGKRNLQFHVPSDEYLIQECFWGEFSRSIVLPDHVDSGRISASFKDGILRISMPKRPGGDSQTKLIKIKSS